MRPPPPRRQPSRVLPATETTTKTSTARVSFTALAVLALVAVFVYGLDQLTKILIVNNFEVGETEPLIGTFLQLHFVKNPGAAFSLGEGSTWIFAIIATAVAIFIVIFAPRIRSIGWAVLFGFLLGGNVGNLTDRLTREPGFGVGHVVDFVQVAGFPAIFNIADSAIVLSMVIFVILTIRGVRINGTKAEPKQKTDAATSDSPAGSV